MIENLNVNEFGAIGSETEIDVNRAEPSLTEPKTVVGSIVNAVAILRHLGASNEPLGVTAVASALGISPSSSFNILRTLVAEGLVEFDPRKKTYALGLGTYDLARMALARSQVFQIAQPRLQDLAKHYSVTGALWRIANDQRIVLVGLAESDAPVRIQFQIAQRAPVLTGASGRCYSATHRLSRAEITRRRGEIAGHRKVSVDEYLAEVEMVHKRGWAEDRDGLMQGVTSVAAPVIDESGAMRYSVAAALFTGQHSPETVDLIGRETRDLAHYLSQRVFGSAADRP